MRRSLLVLLCLACERSAAPGASGSSGSSSASGAVAPPSAVPDAAGPDAAPACEVAGAYRLRIAWGTSDHHWFEFQIAGTPPVATIQTPRRMLGFDGALEVSVDPARCTFTFDRERGKSGQETIVATLDPASKRVTGEYLRGDPATARKRGAAKSFTGVRDGGTRAPAAADACFERGIYQVTYANQPAWEADEPAHSCEPASAGPLLLGVDWLGDELVIEMVERAGTTWRESGYAEERLARKGPCSVDLKVNKDRLEIDTSLTFVAGGKGQGSAAELRFQAFQPVNMDMTEDGPPIYCRSGKVALTLERIATR